MLVDTSEGPVPLSRLLPAAFGTEDLGTRRDGGAQQPGSGGSGGRDGGGHQPGTVGGAEGLVRTPRKDNA